MEELSRALGLYVHVPFCKSRCAYCDFVSSTDSSLQQIYIDCLCKEIAERATREIADSVYIGGGTPSMLFRGGITRVLKALQLAFRISEKAEITVEANPDSCTEDFIKECADNGVNRLSLGLQTSDDALLRQIGRPHRFQDFLQVVHIARNAKIDNISCDIMLGLPGDTPRNFQETLNAVLQLPLKHISAYGLKVEEGTALYQTGFLPNEDMQADMYDMALARLTAHGYQRYEVSNFAKDNYESRHNLKYWMRVPYYGFGAAAHSFYRGYRTENTSNISVYLTGKQKTVCEKILRDAAVEEYIMPALRTAHGIDYGVLDRDYGFRFSAEKKREITRLLSEGLLEKTEIGVKIAENAFYVMNSILLCLL